MYAHGILTLLLLILAFWVIWKFLIAPRIADEPDSPEHVKILEDKIEKLQEMKAEYESVRKEKDVTQQLQGLDDQIEELIKEIKSVENA